MPRDPAVAGAASAGPTCNISGLGQVVLGCARIALAVTVVAAGSLAAAAATPAAKTAPKTHTLYMGADISIEQDGALHRVQDIEGESFVIVVHGKRMLVSMRSNPLLIKITESLKVARSSAAIEKLRANRAYTSANNPHHKFVRQAGAASGAAASVDVATAGLTSAQSQLGALQAAQASNPAAGLDGAIMEAQQGVMAASQQLDSTSALASSDLANPGYYAGLLQAELSQELFDALEMSFEVSSAQRLENPYIIIVTRYREREDKPGASRNWVYAQALGPVDQKPRKVRVLRGGFPLGFDMESYRLHLYEGGVEVPTTVSRRRVELTADEAFQYSVIDYISRHKAATLGARPMRIELELEATASLSPTQLNRKFYVQVTKDGRPGGAFLDEKCSDRLDEPALRPILQRLRFNPALENGKPVDSVAAVQLGEVLRH